MIVCLHVTIWPLESVAVQVIIVTPTGKSAFKGFPSLRTPITVMGVHPPLTLGLGFKNAPF